MSLIQKLSPLHNNSTRTWAESYENFLLSNASKISSLESSIRSLSYLATGQMQDVELVTETLYSVLQLLSLYHDKLINNSIQRLAKGERNSGNQTATTNSGCKNGSEKDTETRHESAFKKLICDPQAIRPSLHNRYTQWAMNKSKLYRSLSLILIVLKQTELLWEMVGKRQFEMTFFGKKVIFGSKKSQEKSRWKTILYIEAIKALLRIGMLASTKGRTVLDCPIPERDVDPERIIKDEEGNIKILNENELREYQQLQQQKQQLYAGINSSGSANDILSNTEAAEKKFKEGNWWRMPRRGIGLPNQSNFDIDEYLSKKVLTVDDVRGPEGLVHKLNALGLSAEVLYILRPLIYATLVYLSSPASKPLPLGAKSKFKLNPWVSWVVGISIELLSRKMLLKSLQQSLPGGLRSITKLESEEYKQRLINMNWWFFRGTMYDQVTRPIIQKVINTIGKVPLVGVVGVLLDDYLYLFDEYYFTASTL